MVRYWSWSSMIRCRWIRNRTQCSSSCSSCSVQVMVMMVMVSRVMMDRTSSTCSRAHLVPQNPRDAWNWRDVVLVANAVGQESVADFPGEDPRVLEFELFDVLDDLGSGDARFAAPYCPWQNTSGLVVPCKNFAHAAVTNAELPRDIARPDAQLRQFDDAKPHRVRQWSTVHKNAA